MKNSFKQAQNPAELFDIVDENDCVVGNAPRAEVHRRKLLHRAVHIFVADARGNIVLQKRSLAKDSAPGLFSTSCAGHVDSGENYETAARRELGEELGISPNDTEKTAFLFSLPPCESLGWEFIRVYFLRHSGTLVPAPAEIEKLASFPPKEIDTMTEKFPEKFAESFLLVWKEFRSRFPDFSVE